MIFTKWKFDLLTEKSKSLLKDFIILILLIPINSLLIQLFFYFVLGWFILAATASKEYDFLMGFLSGFIHANFCGNDLHRIFLFNTCKQNKGKAFASSKSKIGDGIKNSPAKYRAAFFV